MTPFRLNQDDDILMIFLRKLSQFPIPGSAEDPGCESLEEISEWIETLFDHIGTETIAELFADAIAAGLISMEKAAACLGIGVWSGSEGGGDLAETVDQWLREGTDPLRVELALRHGVFLLFRGEAELWTVLAVIAERFPQFSSLCDWHLNSPYLKKPDGLP